MKTYLAYASRLVVSSLRDRCRFVRLSPGKTGKIAFYDKLKKRKFHVFSRGRIDSNTADQIYKNHDYDLQFLMRYEDIRAQYEDILKQGKTPLIVDCGANIGLSSRYFAEEFPEATLVAIEPDKGNCEMIGRNCGHLSNIVLKNAAVGSAPGFVDIVDPSADPNAFQMQRKDGAGGIELVTINGIIEEFPDTVPLLAKIDIEGFEKELFSANTEWVDRFPLLVIETHDWMMPKEANSQNFLKVIAQKDRDFIFRGENVFSIAN